MPFAEEAERTRWYFREYLKLPVVLGIWHQPATVRADGRRMQDFSPNIKAYSGALRGSGRPDFALVDPQGIIRLTGNVTNDEEARIDHVIADMYETPKQEIGNVR
jgi:hypothetical protein